MVSLLDRLKYESKKNVTKVSKAKNKEIEYRIESIELFGEQYLMKKVFVKNDKDYNTGWVLDNQTKSCMRCDGGFGMMKWKHHCRSCGFLTCGSCCNKKLKIPALEEAKSGSKVCKYCYNTFSPSKVNGNSQARTIITVDGTAVDVSNVMTASKSIGQDLEGEEEDEGVDVLDQESTLINSVDYSYLLHNESNASLVCDGAAGAAGDPNGSSSNVPEKSQLLALQQAASHRNLRNAPQTSSAFASASPSVATVDTSTLTNDDTQSLNTSTNMRRGIAETIIHSIANNHHQHNSAGALNTSVSTASTAFATAAGANTNTSALGHGHGSGYPSSHQHGAHGAAIASAAAAAGAGSAGGPTSSKLYAPKLRTSDMSSNGSSNATVAANVGSTMLMPDHGVPAIVSVGSATTAATSATGSGSGNNNNNNNSLGLDLAPPASLPSTTASTCTSSSGNTATFILGGGGGGGINHHHHLGSSVPLSSTTGRTTPNVLVDMGTSSQLAASMGTQPSCGMQQNAAAAIPPPRKSLLSTSTSSQQQHPPCLDSNSSSNGILHDNPNIPGASELHAGGATGTCTGRARRESTGSLDSSTLSLDTKTAQNTLLNGLQTMPPPPLAVVSTKPHYIHDHDHLDNGNMIGSMGSSHNSSTSSSGGGGGGSTVLPAPAQEEDGIAAAAASSGVGIQQGHPQHTGSSREFVVPESPLTTAAHLEANGTCSLSTPPSTGSTGEMPVDMSKFGSPVTRQLIMEDARSNVIWEAVDYGTDGDTSTNCSPHSTYNSATGRGGVGGGGGGSSAVSSTGKAATLSSLRYLTQAESLENQEEEKEEEEMHDLTPPKQVPPPSVATAAATAVPIRSLSAPEQPPQPHKQQQQPQSSISSASGVSTANAGATAAVAASQQQQLPSLLGSNRSPYYTSSPYGHPQHLGYDSNKSSHASSGLGGSAQSSGNTTTTSASHPSAVEEKENQKAVVNQQPRSHQRPSQQKVKKQAVGQQQQRQKDMGGHRSSQHQQQQQREQQSNVAAAVDRKRSNSRGRNSTGTSVLTSIHTGTHSNGHDNSRRRSTSNARRSSSGNNNNNNNNNPNNESSRSAYHQSLLQRQQELLKQQQVLQQQQQALKYQQYHAMMNSSGTAEGVNLEEMDPSLVTPMPISFSRAPMANGASGVSVQRPAAAMMVPQSIDVNLPSLRRSHSRHGGVSGGSNVN